MSTVSTQNTSTCKEVLWDMLNQHIDKIVVFPDTIDLRYSLG
jgi:hypothetical protein